MNFHRISIKLHSCKSKITFRRNNGFWDETFKDNNLERECAEETCSSEEVIEYYNGNVESARDVYKNNTYPCDACSTDNTRQ